MAGVRPRVVSSGNPPAVQRVLATYELDVGRLTRFVGGESASKSLDHFRGFGHSFGVIAQVAYNLGHINIVISQHLVSERIVTIAPEPRAISCKPTVADVCDGDTELLT